MWAVKEYNDHGEFIGATFYHTIEDAHRLFEAITLNNALKCEVTYISHTDNGKIYEIKADEDEING